MPLAALRVGEKPEGRSIGIGKLKAIGGLRNIVAALLGKENLRAVGEFQCGVAEVFSSFVKNRLLQPRPKGPEFLSREL